MRSLELIYSRHNAGSTASEILPQAIPYCDLTVVLKGPVEYAVNGQRYVLEDGDAVFMSEGDIRARSESQKGVDYVSFNFKSECDYAIPTVLRKAVHSEALLLIAAYDKIESRAYLDNKEKTENILSCLLCVFEDRARTENFNPLTMKIIKYIHANLSRRITLEEIGQLTFFSPIYCDTVFKRETGRSIIDYALDQRIEEAKKLLLDGSLNFSQVAEAVGFGDYNYFSRAFKKRSGYTPSKYKRMVSRAGV